jgi:putative ABC transport system substrate-binding protein
MERLNRARVPAIYQSPDYARLGAPLAYGTDLVARRRQVAALVEKVLSGTKPADLPARAANQV